MAQDDAYKKVHDSLTDDSLGKFYELNKDGPKDAGSKWVQTINIPEKDGFSLLVHKRPVEGSALDICRAECMIRNVTLASMKKFTYEYDKYSKRIDKKNM